MLLFVGRIQPLKGLDVADRRAGRARHSDAQLVVVGGPSGPDGEAEAAKALPLADELGVADRIRWVDAAAPPSARDLLPRRRRVCRAEPVGVVRPRRPRGRGLRHPGRGRGGRRSAHARRARRDRLPRRGARNPTGSLAPSTQLLADPATARAMSDAAATRARGLHVVHDRGAPAPPLRRPHRARSRSTAPPDDR